MVHVPVEVAAGLEPAPVGRETPDGLTEARSEHGSPHKQQVYNSSAAHVFAEVAVDSEPAAVGRHDARSWLRQMCDIRFPRFVEAHPAIALSERGAVAKAQRDGIKGAVTAATSVLPVGRHYVEFTSATEECPRPVCAQYGRCVCPYGTYIGVIAESCDVRGGWDAHIAPGNCLFIWGSGGVVTTPRCHNWHGIPGSAQLGDRVGLLLDTNKGSLAVFKNDVLAGMMVESGLMGRYRWAVCISNHVKVGVRITGAQTIPSDPTPSELDAARARAAPEPLEPEPIACKNDPGVAGYIPSAPLPPGSYNTVVGTIPESELGTSVNSALHVAYCAPPSFGGIEEQEVLVHICRFLLDCPADLGHLACASSAFGRKTMWAGNEACGVCKGERSVVEETARRWVQREFEVATLH